MLYALEVPDLYGLPLGDTEFASAAAAWDALPAPIRDRIDGRRAIFDFSGRKRAFPLTQAEIDRYPPVRHPIVRRIRLLDRNASMSCATIAPVSRASRQKKPRR